MVKNWLDEMTSTRDSLGARSAGLTTSDGLPANALFSLPIAVAAMMRCSCGGFGSQFSRSFMSTVSDVTRLVAGVVRATAATLTSAGCLDLSSVRLDGNGKIASSMRKNPANELSSSLSFSPSKRGSLTTWAMPG